MRPMHCFIPIIIALCAGLALGWWGGAWGEHVTLVSLSPDEQTRVWLVEQPHWIDRNFVVRVEKLPGGETHEIFRSPDEGRPVGSERIVWSADSELFLLLGRHFYVDTSARLNNGEQLYLLHHLRLHRTWSNASQQVRLAPFSMADLSSMVWQKTPCL